MDERLSHFWEHLEELRSTLIRSLLVVGLSFSFLLIFYQPIFHFLTSPLYPVKEGISAHPLRRVQLVNHTNENKIFFLPKNSWIEANQSGVIADKEANGRIPKKWVSCSHPYNTLLSHIFNQAPSFRFVVRT